MYRLTELKRLAEAYLAATRITADTLSTRIAGRSNNRMIGVLLRGGAISATSAEKAATFFNEHWPDAPWPDDVPREPSREAAE